MRKRLILLPKNNILGDFYADSFFKKSNELLVLCSSSNSR